MTDESKPPPSPWVVLTVAFMVLFWATIIGGFLLYLRYSNIYTPSGLHQVDRKAYYDVPPERLREFVAIVDGRARHHGFKPKWDVRHLLEATPDASVDFVYERTDGTVLFLCSKRLGQPQILVGIVDVKERENWRTAMDDLEAALASFPRPSSRPPDVVIPECHPEANRR